MSFTTIEKKLALSPEAKRDVIEPAHAQISVAWQCALVGLSRSSVYYVSKEESAENLHLIRILDAQYTHTPFYRVRRMMVWLRPQDYVMNPKCVAWSLRTMGLETTYPTPRLSQLHPERRVSPYWLHGVPITRVNHVWSTDITSIRVHAGLVYLVAVMDWFSRYELSWGTSITMDVGFCLEAFERALDVATPDIFKSDQGSQFTSVDLTGRLVAAGICISMDGRGRALDNVCVERL